MQQLLIIGALAILGVTILTFNQSTLNVNANRHFNIALTDATASAQSLVEEIQTRAFDQSTVSTHVSATSSLTTTNLLGPENGESSKNHFNDIDDFNNYTQADTFQQFGIFTSIVKVNYVQKYSPEIISNTPTFMKRILISVHNPFLVDTLKLTRIISY